MTAFPPLHPVTAIVIGIVTMQVSTLATSVYLHRALSHGAVAIRPCAAIPLRFVIWIATGIRPREWAAVHRRHHAHVDTIDDPHSPLVLGFWRVQLTNAFLYRGAVRDRASVARYSRDLPPDFFDRMIFDRGWLGPALGTASLCVVLGWPTGLLAAAVHTVLYIGVNGAVNSVGHTYGRRTDPTSSSTNGRVLALVSMGEGLHSNHHAMPTSACLAFKRGEIDPGWWCVRAMRRLGWLTVRPTRARPTVPVG